MATITQFFKKRKKKNNVNFYYPKNKKARCNLKTKNAEWGCCCDCDNRKTVYNHCTFRDEFENNCICNDSLDFYVCIAIHDWVRISTEHGVCTLYKKRTFNKDYFRRTQSENKV